MERQVGGWREKASPAIPFREPAHHAIDFATLRKIANFPLIGRLSPPHMGLNVSSLQWREKNVCTQKREKTAA